MEDLKRRERNILKWIEDPHRSFIIAIFLIMLAIRIYYLIVTWNQPVWWDEGDYLNIARMWAFGTPQWDINPLRPLLFPAILAILFKLHAPEFIMRLIPLLSSILAIILTYLIGKELYNKQIGLMAAFMLSFFWSFLFFSYRILVDVPVATLWLLSLWLFIMGYEHKKKSALWLFIPAIIITFLMKFTGALLGLIILFYLIITERVKILKNKDLWISLGLGILAALPFLVYETKKFGHPLAFYTAAIGGRALSPRSLWQTFLDYINTTFPLIEWAFLILFIIGFVILIFELAIGLDLLFKNKEKKLKANLLLLLTFLVPFLYIVSIGYGIYIEERYLFLMYPLMFIIGGKGLYSLFEKTKKYNKPIAIAILVVFLAIGFYQNIAHANDIIQNKKTSFLQVKQAGQWINEHSNENDLIYSLHTQAELQYAANRRVKGIPGKTPEELVQTIKETKPKYIVINIFANLDPSDEWKVVFPYVNAHLFTKELSYEPYIDTKKTIPVLTIFSIKPEFYATELKRVQENR